MICRECNGTGRRGREDSQPCEHCNGAGYARDDEAQPMSPEDLDRLWRDLGGSE